MSVKPDSLKSICSYNWLVVTGTTTSCDTITCIGKLHSTGILGWFIWGCFVIADEFGSGGIACDAWCSTETVAIALVRVQLEDVWALVADILALVTSTVVLFVV